MGGAIELVARRVRQDRRAARRENPAHGLGETGPLVGDIARPARREESIKDLLDLSADSGLYQGPCEVGAADQVGISCKAKGGIHDRGQAGRHQGGVHLMGALESAGLHGPQGTGEGGVRPVKAQSHEVERAPPPGDRDLHTVHKAHAEIARSRLGLLQPIQGVMVGDGHQVHPMVPPTQHQRSRTQHAVRGGRVHVEVYIKIMGKHVSILALSPMPIYLIAARRPSLDPTSYVAPGAQLIGEVFLGPRASVWFNAVVRADNDQIVIGAESNIQDGAVLHVDPGFPIDIGEGVTVGHQAMLHGCSIGKGSLIGIQAILLNGVKVGENCLIGAGSLLTAGTEVPDGSLVLGRPAKVVRTLSPEEIGDLWRTAKSYASRAEQYSSELQALDL